MKKVLLMLFLSIGATVFASPVKNIAKIKNKKAIIRVMQCSTSCDGVTFSFSAGSAAEAVSIASRYCAGGVISINN